jgi:hypothetical protein
MVTRWRLPSAIVLFLAVPGCGGGTGTPAAISMDDYNTEWRDATCARATQCGSYSDKATCVASMQLGFGQVMADIQAGKRTFDGAAASKCLEYLRAFVTAPCTFSGQAVVTTDPACGQVFKGTLADGAACSDGGQCLSAACNVTSCSGTPACCMGTCAPTMPPIQLGGGCETGGSCVSGTFCKGMMGSAVCTAIIADGQPCDTTMHDVCTPGTICTDAVCRKPPADGESCTDQCDQLSSFCDFQSGGTCVPKKAVGAACSGGFGCVDTAYCDALTSACIAKGKAGDTCDMNQSGSCLGALQCIGGTCAFPTAPATCP